MEKPYLYLAGPMFNEADKAYNMHIRELLLPLFKVYLPQLDRDVWAELIDAGKTEQEAASYVIGCDKESLDTCNILLAVMHGPEVDDGTACEIGYLHGRGELCYGLQTDIRRTSQFSNNLFVESCLDAIFVNEASMIGFFKRMCGDAK